MAAFLLGLCVCAAACAQANEAGVFAVGNFNPTYPVYLDYGRYEIFGGNKSSLGGGFEYRHYWSAGNALGLLYAQNASDGKLVTAEELPARLRYVWPLMRHEVLVLETEQLGAGSWAPFVSEGFGWLVTDGYGNSGWSENFAVAAGLGVDRRLGKRTAWRSGVTFVDATDGCYRDKTCKDTWSVIEDVRTGLVLRW